MSSPTWTPDGLASEAKPWGGRGWRLVEAQHRVSTLKLVDGLGEQALLEALLEATKPPLPVECRGLDDLLATPFRYDPPYPHGSRFWRPGRTAGVFYAAEQPETAVAEMAFHRLLFFAESPATPWPDDAAAYTAFSAAIASDRHLDLTVPPLDRDAPVWSDPMRYEACQALADQAREVEVPLLRYRSARDPEHGMALAVLSCSAFAEPTPIERRTWRMRLSRHGVQALCEFPVARLEFGRDAFVADPRIADLGWDR